MNGIRLVADLEVLPYTYVVKSQKVSVAQGIEQQPPKLWVAGSIPAWDVKKTLYPRQQVFLN